MEEPGNIERSAEITLGTMSTTKICCSNQMFIDVIQYDSKLKLQNGFQLLQTYVNEHDIDAQISNERCNCETKKFCLTDFLLNDCCYNWMLFSSFLWLLVFMAFRFYGFSFICALHVFCITESFFFVSLRRATVWKATKERFDVFIKSESGSWSSDSMITLITIHSV